MILQSLVGLYERLERRSASVPSRGYGLARIGFVLELKPNGEPIGLIDCRYLLQNRLVAPLQMVPAALRTSKGKPAFLWGNTAYVFGVTAIKSVGDQGNFKSVVPGRRKQTTAAHAAFRMAHFKALADCDDKGLRALLLFLQRWTHDQWTARSFTCEALDHNVAFRLLGDEQRIDERFASKELVRGQEAVDAQSAQCLVTGLRAPLAVLHPKFHGVLGAHSAGAPLVSFAIASSRSYGKEKGANAAVSVDAAFRYGAALEWLLDGTNYRSFRLGETTVVLWADQAVADTIAEQRAQLAEKIILEEFVPSSLEVQNENTNTSGIKLAITEDSSLTPHTSTLLSETRINILGLSPNNGRLAVRLSLSENFGKLSSSLALHREQMRIEPPGGAPYIKVFSVLYELAVFGKAKNIPPRLGCEIAQAILIGSTYPRTMFIGIIARIRADKSVNTVRAAICKAVINRDIDAHNRPDHEKIPVALDPDSSDPAYNLGRLFAINEYAEQAVARRTSGIRNKFLGAASASPGRLFPTLMRGYWKNAATLVKGDGRQRAAALKASRAIRKMLEQFSHDASFPTSLALEGQGRFFVGYYHQNCALYKSDAGSGQAGSDVRGVK